MSHEVLARIYSNEYYLALGRFVSEFTEIECTMQVALWRLSKVNSPVAQAVFSGVRAEESSSKITRIAEAENWSKERQAQWKVISNRLGILRTLRNDILHYGATWRTDGSLLISNEGYAHAPRKIVKTPITITHLAHATSDLQKLGLHIFHFIFADEMTPKAFADGDPVLRRAWHYKSPRQGGRPDRNPDTDPKRPRPPRPSSASRRTAALERSKTK
jgi:hypothetical protein